MNEKSLFAEILGSSPEIKTLDFLLTMRSSDYSLTELARSAKVGWSTLHIFWPRWVKNKIVVKTRRIGRAQMYALNKENAFVNGTAKLYDSAVSDLIESEIANRKKRSVAFEAKQKISARA